MQARLTKELAQAYRDYCNITWDEALNVVGIPADSALRQPGSIYYHPDIREVPGAQTALVPEASEQSLVAQTTIPPPKALKGSNETGDQGQGAKDKGKGTKPPSEAKDAAKAKEVRAKAKEAEAETKEVDPKAKDNPTIQQSQKKLS